MSATGSRSRQNAIVLTSLVLALLIIGIMAGLEHFETRQAGATAEPVVVPSNFEGNRQADSVVRSTFPPRRVPDLDVESDSASTPGDQPAALQGVADGSAPNDGTGLVSGLDLAGADLRGVGLEAVDYRNANLKGADLTEAKVLNTDLRSADLSDTRWFSAIVWDSRLDGADLRNADIRGSNFTRTNLRGADLRNLNAGPGIVEGIPYGVGFDDLDLSDADLRWADMTAAFVWGTIFRGADLRGADFRGANALEGAHWRGAVYDQTTRFPVDFDPIHQGMILKPDQEAGDG